MLETFPWTGGTVLAAPHAVVVAADSPRWDVLAEFDAGSVFGFVLSGENATLRHRGRAFGLQPGAYFVVPAGAGHLTNPGGRILLIGQPGATHPFMVGGPIEERGRLRYIDGCTDSLLIPPWRKGEACLNLLHLPPGIEQTMHTHPSDRIGVVVSGQGQCVTPDGTTDLRPGLLWRLPADAPHRFRTEGHALRIVAWHPDSDVGPTDDEQPMLSRTIIDGVSAADPARAQYRTATA